MTARTLIHVLCCLVSFLFAVQCYSQVLAHKPVRHILNGAEQLQTFATEGGYVRQVETTGNLVSMLLWARDSSLVVIRSLDGTEQLRIGLSDNDGRRISWFDLSEDGSTLLLYDWETEAVEGWGESWRVRVYNIDGTFRFEKYSETYLLPSPSGTSFCNQSTEMSGESFTLYAGDGQPISQWKHFSEWRCRFVDNKRLILTYRDSLALINTSDGSILRSLNTGLHEEFVVPHIRTSDTIIAVFDHASILILTLGLYELWRESFEDYLLSVAIDDETGRIALLFEDRSHQAGYFRFLSVATPADVVTTQGFPSLSKSPTPSTEIAWFANGLLTLWCPPGTQQIRQRDDTFERQTLFVQDPGKPGGTADFVFLPDHYHLVARQGMKTQYLRVFSRSDPTLLSISREAE